MPRLKCTPKVFLSNFRGAYHFETSSFYYINNVSSTNFKCHKYLFIELTLNNVCFTSFSF